MTDLETQSSLKRKFATARRRAERKGGDFPVAWFLTDPVRTPDPVAIAAALPPGWGLIYRHFGAADRHEVGRKLAVLARRRRLCFLISYDRDMLDLDIAGIHWPRWSLAQRRQSRKIHGLIETTSAHDFRGIVKADRLGMRACFVSAVYPSQSPSAPAAMGLHKLDVLQRRTRMPIIALGGVNAGNAVSVARISGFAAIDGVCAAFGDQGV